METTSPSTWEQQRDQYLSERVDGQIKWYGGKSRANKKWYYLSRTIIIVSGALIPLLVGYASGNWEWLKYVAGALGAVVAVSEGVLSLKKYLENWTTYRSTSERLKREKLLYLNKVGEDYAGGDETAFKQFVVKAELIMSSENQDWSAHLDPNQGK